jgi:hypothetical protein
MILVDGRHEYDYSLEDDNVHTLRYSDNGSWTFPKEVAMQVTDDGNGLIVKFSEKGRIDYSEAEMLLILLKLINTEKTTYEVVTQKEKL